MKSGFFFWKKKYLDLTQKKKKKTYLEKTHVYIYTHKIVDTIGSGGNMIVLCYIYNIQVKMYDCHIGLGIFNYFKK